MGIRTPNKDMLDRVEQYIKEYQKENGKSPTIFSLFIFKEKMRWWQCLGVVIGTIAILLLSI